MYANLKVTTANGREMYAWQVEVGPNETRVFLDDPTDESSYAAPKGELRFAPGTRLTIAASF